MDLLPFIQRPDSCGKAIRLLDEATAIDSTYFTADFNKLVFYNQLRQFDKSMATVDRMIRLRPSAHDLYLQGGYLRERTGDPASAKPYFEKSLAISKAVLDTMRISNRDYSTVASNRALALVMLGDTAEGRQVFQKLLDEKPDDVAWSLNKELMGKNKEALMRYFEKMP